MDLQGGLIVGGVTVAVCAVLILISLFGSSGTSYEQAVAEQRRATSELLALAGNNKQAQKKSKKAGKKAKEKKRQEVVTGSERESDAPADSGQEEEHRVEFADTVATDPPKQQIRKQKDTKLKPILVNKEEVVEPASSPSPPAVSNHFVQIHPKDEFELLNDKVEKSPEVVEKKEVKSAKPGKKAKLAASPPGPAPPAASAAPAPVPEPVIEEPVAKEIAVESAKEQRKTKKHEKRQASEDVVDRAPREDPAPVSLPVPSELTTDKILKNIAPIPIAQPKQKKKKQDQSVLGIVGADVAGVNVSELVRLVSEAALSRNEIQILTDALLNKQHGVLPQHSEWTEGPNDPVQKLKKQLAEKEKSLADEQEASQAVHNKLKELRASLNTERSRANAAVRAAEEAASTSKVEIHTLQTRMQRLLDDNHTLAQDKLMLQSKLQSEADASAQRAVQLEMQMQQRINETEAALVQQLGALQGELGALQGEVGARAHEAAQARNALHQAQAHAADLAHRLQESDRMYGEVETARAALVHAEQAASAELRELKATLQRERQEADARNRQLTSELKMLREQLAAKEEQLAAKEEQLAAKEEQLLAKEEQIKKEHTNHQQNGLLPDDSQKKQELTTLEGVVETLKAELAAALASHEEERKQLSHLQQQLQQYRDKNNEAVSKALEAQSRQTAEVLRAACPQVAPAGAADSEWLATFADQLRTVLKAASTTRDSEPREDERVLELTGQNAHLQELVDKYKKIIDDTEGVLDKLQYNVTAEEQRWERLLDEKQRELDRLQQTTVTQMQSKIDALQAELDSRGRATFADMERGLEENDRLLISEKRQTHNGPTQVGLEEK